MRRRGARRCETWRGDMWRDLRRRNMRGWRRNTRSRGKATATPAAMGSGGKTATSTSTTAPAAKVPLLRVCGGRKRSGNKKESCKPANLRTHGFRAPHRAPFLKRLTDTRVSKDLLPPGGKPLLVQRVIYSHCGIAAHKLSMMHNAAYVPRKRGREINIHREIATDFASASSRW